MRSTTVWVAALAAASSVAGHDMAARRKIYYPRHVKREFTNSTIAAVDVPISHAAPSSTLPADAKVTTIVVQSTIFVPPTAPTVLSNGSEPGSSLPPLLGRPPHQSSAPSSVEPAANSSHVVSVAISTTSSSSTAILLFPTGASSVMPSSTAPTSTMKTPTMTSTTAPTTTTTPTKTKDPLQDLTSILSEIVSAVTSIAHSPLHNATESLLPTSKPPFTIPTSKLPISIPTSKPPVTIPTSLPTEPGTGVASTATPPVDTSKPPVVVSSPPVPPPTSTFVEPPPSNTTEVPVSHPPVTVTNSTISQPPITVPPSSMPSGPVTIGNNTHSANVTSMPTPTTTFGGVQSEVTSIPHLGTTVNSQSWLPTTLVLATSTADGAGLAPTSQASAAATGLPGGIIPNGADTDAPAPPNSVKLQIGFLAGYNYPFVVANQRSAAQIFSLLPEILSNFSGTPVNAIPIQKLSPLDTSQSLGYITTLAILLYPDHLVTDLAAAIKTPNSPLYNMYNLSDEGDALRAGFAKQINNAIEIIYGDGLDGAGGDPSNPTASTAPNAFGNDNTDTKTPGQQGTTAGILGGAVVVAAAYGAVMFIIARRYKSKKQAHRRASSLTGDSSEMRQTPRSSPALMGGALLSRDFTSSYGGVAAGRERDSQGSGRSGMNTSSRTQYISAPVAAENSLGWN